MFGFDILEGRLIQLTKLQNGQSESLDQNTIDALQGSEGTPSDINRFVTDQDLDDVKNDINNIQNVTYKITYFEIIDISTSTNGNITIPTGATIEENSFGESGNSVLSEISISNKPTYETPKDTGNNFITANLNSFDGSYITNSIYSTPVAIIYTLVISLNNFNNLNKDLILDYYEETSLLEENINQEILDRKNGDEGSVSIHNDMDLSSSSNNNKEILSNNGSNIFIPRTLELDDLNDVNTQAIVPEIGWILKYDGTNFIPILRKVIRNSSLLINSTNTFQDKIRQNINIQRLNTHSIKVSYSWSLNDGGQDIRINGSFGGVSFQAILTSDDDIHRQEPKDVLGPDPDGRGTNQKHGFSHTFYVTPISLGITELILRVAGSQNNDLASLWESSIIIEEELGIIGN